MEAQGRRRETSRHRSASRFALPRPVGRAAAVLMPLLSLLPPVVLLVVVQSLSPVAQRLPTGAARFDLAAAWLVTEPGALAGTTSWLTAPTLGRLQLGLLLRVLQGGGAQSVLAAAHGAMLLLTVLQAVLLWWVLRRTGAGGVAAGLATAVFAIAPIAVATHTAVSAVAVGACWLLAAVGLGLARRRSPLVGAGACAAVAIASAPVVALAAVPLAVLLVLRLRSPRYRDDGHPAEHPRHPLRSVGVGFGAAALLLAVGAAAVAALPATARSAQLDALVGAQGTAPTLGAAALARWIGVDPLSALVALSALVLTAVLARDRSVTVMAAVLLAASVWPLGDDPVAPLVLLLPVVVAAVARSVDVGVVALGNPMFVRSVLGSAWLTGVAAVLVVATIGWLVGLSALVPAGDQPVAKVERWIVSSVPAGQTVLVPLAVWPDLDAVRADVGWFATDRGAAASSVPWRDADYVVADPSLRPLPRSAAATVLQRSLRVATFGNGPSALSLRAVRHRSAQPAPPPPTTAAARAAARLRRSAGVQLSQNPRIEVTGDVRAQLLAGEVDIRTVLVLAQFATTHRVTVGDFGFADGRTSGVRSTVTISAVDGRPVPSDGTKAGVVLRFLSGLRGQFATESIDASNGGITVRFPPHPDLVPTG